ncbi:UNVERIFIED_ORG: LysR family transcriptional regulator [Shinella sp. XGS7]|nr:LysR family transcriptional regulator [Shinella sp. XGS7]
MTSSPGWELYRSFLAVLQEGSLSGAARALGLTQPTVGRHVSALEQALDLSLFTRSAAGLQPTESALALREDAELMQSTAAALERAARGLGQAVQGAVRISASEVMGVEVLPPILSELQAQHPQLEIELVLSNRVQDLLRREADIAVRMTVPRQEALLATRVGEVPLGLHAHRRYLARHGMPQSLAELAGHRLIGYDQETPFLRAASARLNLPAWSRERFAARCDSDLGQLALLRAGAGIGICQIALARRDPELVQLFPQQFSMALESWVVMHEGLRRSPRCRVSFDALVQGLRAYMRQPPAPAT